MSDERYVDGLFYWKPHAKAPDFVKGTLSIHLERMIAWLSSQEAGADNKGFIRVDMLSKKDGEGLSFKLNEYQRPEANTAPADDDDVPW